MRKTILLITPLLSFLIFSCVGQNENENKNIDQFYSTRSFGDIPTRPLLKPLRLMFDKESKKWTVDVPLSFKQYLLIDSIFEIGVEKSYIYGKISERKEYVERYQNKDYVFVDKYNVISRFTEQNFTREDQIRIYPTDSVSKTFILPERWFVINVADSTIEAFFSKPKYQNYLKEKGISGKLYNIDSINKEFIETGSLPWFPDSVKAKLTK